MVANISAYQNLPGNASNFLYVDGWRWTSFGINWFCARFNRPLNTGEGLVARYNVQLSEPQMVPGSVKAGQPIEHPEWRYTWESGPAWGQNTNPYSFRSNEFPGFPMVFPLVFVFTPLGGPSRVVSPLLRREDFRGIIFGGLDCSGQY